MYPCINAKSFIEKKKNKQKKTYMGGSCWRRAGVCERNPQNSHDCYAVAVKREDILIRHLRRKLSRLCSLFLRRGGAMFCVVTGGRRYLVDLPQGGLEVPCSLLFKHKPKDVEKL